MNKHVLFIAGTLFLFGCASAKLMTPTQADVDRVQSKYPNYSLADLNAGKLLYENNCGNCHGLKDPASRSEEKWKKVVPEMVAKVNKKSKVLSEQDQEHILKYVVTMSSAASTTKSN